MKKFVVFILVIVLALYLFGCVTTQQDGKTQEPNTDQENSLNKSEGLSAETQSAYTYEELSEMPAEELLDLFIQNGLVINDDLKASFTDKELQTLFKEQFDMWHRGISVMSHTMFIDLAEQTKEIYDKITEQNN